MKILNGKIMFLLNLFANKVSKSIGIITKVRFYLSIPLLRTLYLAFSILTCNMEPLFGGDLRIKLL